MTNPKQMLFGNDYHDPGVQEFDGIRKFITNTRSDEILQPHANVRYRDMKYEMLTPSNPTIFTRTGNGFSVDGLVSGI